VGLVNVDVACDLLAIDDAGPVGVPSFQDPRLNPTGKSRLAKQIAHDLRMMGPNIGHLPLLCRRSRPRRNSLALSIQPPARLMSPLFSCWFHSGLHAELMDRRLVGCLTQGA